MADNTVYAVQMAIRSNKQKRWVCVYCGSRAGRDPRYLAGATALGTALAQADIGLVYGGACVGLMGALADAAMAAGGSVLGVMPRGLAERELSHPGLTELQVVDTMHQRKAAMAAAADGFIAMPGGFGTLEEMFEVLTWHQIGWHDKPMGLLDIADFYQPLLACLRQMAEQGFITQDNVERIVVRSEPEALVQTLSGELAMAATRDTETSA